LIINRERKKMRLLKKDPLSKIAIKFKLPLSFVALYLIVFGAGGYFIVNSVYDSLDKEIISRLRSESLAQAVIFDKKLETFGRRAEDFASDGFIRTQTEILTSSSNRKKAFYLKTRQKLENHLENNKLPLIEEFVDLQIFDLNFKQIAGVKKNPIQIKRYLTSPIQIEQTKFSSIITENDNPSFPSLAIITPLWDIKRIRKIGYLVCLLDLRRVIFAVAKEYGFALSNPNLEKRITLIDQKGVSLKVPGSYLEQINSQNDGYAPLKPAELDFMPIKTNLPLSFHHGRHICIDGKDMFGQSYPLGSTGWNLLIELNARDALKPIDVLEGNLLGVALVVALSTLLLLFFPVQFVIRPLGELQKMAFKIKEGDFSARVNIDSEDEIGNLSRSFNLMAKAIEERTSRLEQTAKDLQKQEKELRLQHDRLNTVVHSMIDGLILLNNKNEVVLSNKAAAPFIHLFKKKDFGIDIRKCDHNDENHSDCIHCLLDTTRKTSCVLYIGETIYEVISTKLPAIDGSSGKVLVARDITERERMNERQAHQERLTVLGKTAAVVAHEMNSPLAAISMYNQMMESELPKDSPFHEHVDVIKRNTQTCQRIIQQLLNYAKTPRPNIQEIDLHQILNHVIHFLAPVCKNKNAVIEHQFTAQKSSVLGDATQMQQVFMNMVLNSIQAIPEKTGKICLRSFESKNKQELIIEIEDNGPGIDLKVKDEIFEPFFTTKSAGGTGLGLSTAKRIVMAHGGDLVLFRTQPGKTVFRIILPYSIQKDERKNLSA